MNYDEMPAGPEMGQLIAERAMGWHARGFDGKWHDWYDGHEFVIGWSRWHPYACVFQAWQVVEKLRQTGLMLRMNDTGAQWRLQFGRAGGRSIHEWVANPNDEYTVWCESFPLAICRAALKAVR